MFYGWKIVAALFVVLMVSSGLGFYNQSVMMEALTTERGFSVATASAAVSIFFLSSGILGPPLAFLLERLDVRPVVAAGAALAGIAMVAIGRADSDVGLFFWQFVFGAGFCASGLLPATTLIARWFETRRAMALSFASTGLSVGGIVMTPLSATLIAGLGLPLASGWLGAIYFLGIAPLAVIVLRGSPGAMGLDVDGRTSPATADKASAPDFSQAIRGSYFWLLGIAYVFVMLAQVGGIAHQYGIVRDTMPAHQAPWALGVLPLFSIIGRLTGGYVIDRISIRTFTCAMMALQVASLVLIAFSGTAWMLIAGLALFGLTVGNLLMLQPLLIAAAFHLDHYARLFSVNNLMTMVGVAAGPAAMGMVLAWTGNYALAFFLAAASGALALAVFGVARPPQAGSA